MPFFTWASTDTGVQFWLSARYVEAAALVLSVLFITRSMNRLLVFWVFGLAVFCLSLIILNDKFPVAYIEGEGLTSFKIMSEYFIVLILTITVFVLYKRRELVEKYILYMMIGAISLTIMAEIAFTLYVKLVSTSMVVGHILKFFSFWLIFVAIVRTSLTEPYQIMARGSSTYDAIPAPTVVVDNEGIIHQANQAVFKLLGTSLSNVIDHHVHDLFRSESVLSEDCEICQCIKDGKSMQNYQVESHDKSIWYEFT